MQILAIVLLTSGCGRKTRPVPPQTILPEKISTLAYQADETGVTLTWNWPVRSEQGGKIRKLSHFLIEKAGYPRNDFCRECPIRYERHFTVEGGQIPTEKKNRQVQFQDHELKPGYHYIYRVSSSMGWNVISEPSEPIDFAWETPLAAPERVAAIAGDTLIHIKWHAVSRDIEDFPVTGNVQYLVYRSSEEDNYSPVTDLISSTEFDDRRVSNGLVYRYKIMAIRENGGLGRFSEIIAVKPADMTPPPTPGGLKAIQTSDGVSLIWDPVVMGDLAGYKIFRRKSFQPPKPEQKTVEQDLEYKEIGSVLSPAISFTDHNLPKDIEAWHYAVSSFDMAEPPNLSPLSWEVKIKREQ